MELLIILISIIVGYLLGSISFARIIASRVDPDVDITKYSSPIPNSDLVYEDDAVSATLVNLHIGWQYGCMTSILDAIKAIVPMVVFQLMFPDQPYYLIISATAMIGHNWPIYYRFKGGRGESVVYGSMLVIDPIGVLVSNVAAIILGVFIGQVHLIRWGGMTLLIPWLWLRKFDLFFIYYIIVVNVIFWISMRKDVTQFYQIYKEGALKTQAEWSDFLDMGSALGRFIDQYSIPALLKRLFD